MSILLELALRIAPLLAVGFYLRTLQRQNHILSQRWRLAVHRNAMLAKGSQGHSKILNRLISNSNEMAADIHRHEGILSKVMEVQNDSSEAINDMLDDQDRLPGEDIEETEQATIH